MKAMFCMLLLGIGGATQAAAITVDFDSTDPTYVGLSSYQEDGFTLSSNVPEGTLIDVNDVARTNLGIFSGGTSSQSLFWGANGQFSAITITQDAGRRFALNALDASSLYNSAGQLQLIGTKVGGGTVSQTLVLNGSLSTYAVSGMNNLSSLQIAFDGSAYAAPFDADNLQFSVVPIPAGVWLFCSALGALVVRLRKAKPQVS